MKRNKRIFEKRVWSAFFCLILILEILAIPYIIAEGDESSDSPPADETATENSDEGATVDFALQTGTTDTPLEEAPPALCPEGSTTCKPGDPISDWENGFNKKTGEMLEGGTIPVGYSGDVTCQSTPCTFNIDGQKMDIEYAEKITITGGQITAFDGTFNEPGVTLNGYKISGGISWDLNDISWQQDNEFIDCTGGPCVFTITPAGEWEDKKWDAVTAKFDSFFPFSLKGESTINGVKMSAEGGKLIMNKAGNMIFSGDSINLDGVVWNDLSRLLYYDPIARVMTFTGGEGGSGTLWMGYSSNVPEGLRINGNNFDLGGMGYWMNGGELISYQGQLVSNPQNPAIMEECYIGWSQGFSDMFSPMIDLLSTVVKSYIAIHFTAPMSLLKGDFDTAARIYSGYEDYKRFEPVVSDMLTPYAQVFEPRKWENVGQQFRAAFTEGKFQEFAIELAFQSLPPTLNFVNALRPWAAQKIHEIKADPEMQEALGTINKAGKIVAIIVATVLTCGAALAAGQTFTSAATTGLQAGFNEFTDQLQDAFLNKYVPFYAEYSGTFGDPLKDNRIRTFDNEMLDAYSPDAGLTKTPSEKTSIYNWETGFNPNYKYQEWIPYYGLVAAGVETVTGQPVNHAPLIKNLVGIYRGSSQIMSELFESEPYHDTLTSYVQTREGDQIKAGMTTLSQDVVVDMKEGATITYRDENGNIQSYTSNADEVEALVIPYGSQIISTEGLTTINSGYAGTPVQFEAPSTITSENINSLSPGDIVTRDSNTRGEGNVLVNVPEGGSITWVDKDGVQHTDANFGEGMGSMTAEIPPGAKIIEVDGVVTYGGSLTGSIETPLSLQSPLKDGDSVLAGSEILGGNADIKLAPGSKLEIRHEDGTTTTIMGPSSLGDGSVELFSLPEGSRILSIKGTVTYLDSGEGQMFYSHEEILSSATPRPITMDNMGREVDLFNFNGNTHDLTYLDGEGKDELLNWIDEYRGGEGVAPTGEEIDSYIDSLRIEYPADTLNLYGRDFDLSGFGPEQRNFIINTVNDYSIETYGNGDSSTGDKVQSLINYMEIANAEESYSVDDYYPLTPDDIDYIQETSDPDKFTVFEYDGTEKTLTRQEILEEYDFQRYNQQTGDDATVESYIPAESSTIPETTTTEESSTSALSDRIKYIEAGASGVKPDSIRYSENQDSFIGYDGKNFLQYSESTKQWTPVAMEKDVFINLPSIDSARDSITINDITYQLKERTDSPGKYDVYNDNQLSGEYDSATKTYELDQPESNGVNVYYQVELNSVNDNLVRQTMLNALGKEESGYGAFYSTLEDIAFNIPFLEKKVTSIGPYQVNRDLAYNLVAGMTELEREQYFPGVYPSHSIVDDFLLTEEGGRWAANKLTDSNEQYLDDVFRLVGYEPLSDDSAEKIVYLGTSYNRGASRSVQAGLQYDMNQIGIQVSIDGYIGEETKIAFDNWLSDRQDEGEYSDVTQAEVDNAFKNGVSGILNSRVWTIIQEEYSDQTEGDNAPLLVPIDYSKTSSDYKTDNYGLRVLSSMEDSDAGAVIKTDSEVTRLQTVNVKVQEQTGDGSWNIQSESIEFDPEFANSLQSSLRYIHGIDPRLSDNLIFSDTIRTSEEQAALQELGLGTAADVGTSSHEFGKAVDININYLSEKTGMTREETISALDEYFGAYGIARTNVDEDWHYELIPSTEAELANELRSQGRLSEAQIAESVDQAFWNANMYGSSGEDTAGISGIVGSTAENSLGTYNGLNDPDYLDLPESMTGKSADGKTIFLDRVGLTPDKNAMYVDKTEGGIVEGVGDLYPAYNENGEFLGYLNGNNNQLISKSNPALKSESVLSDVNIGASAIESSASGLTQYDASRSYKVENGKVNWYDSSGSYIGQTSSLAQNPPAVPQSTASSTAPSATSSSATSQTTTSENKIEYTSKNALVSYKVENNKVYIRDLGPDAESSAWEETTTSVETLQKGVLAGNLFPSEKVSPNPQITNSEELSTRISDIDTRGTDIKIPSIRYAPTLDSFVGYDGKNMMEYDESTGAWNKITISTDNFIQLSPISALSDSVVGSSEQVADSYKVQTYSSGKESAELVYDPDGKIQLRRPNVDLTESVPAGRPYEVLEFVDGKVKVNTYVDAVLKSTRDAELVEEYQMPTEQHVEAYLEGSYNPSEQYKQGDMGEFEVVQKQVDAALKEEDYDSAVDIVGNFLSVSRDKDVQTIAKSKLVELYVESGDFVGAKQLIEQMKSEGIAPLNDKLALGSIYQQTFGDSQNSQLNYLDVAQNSKDSLAVSKAYEGLARVALANNDENEGLKSALNFLTLSLKANPDNQDASSLRTSVNIGIGEGSQYDLGQQISARFSPLEAKLGMKDYDETSVLSTVNQVLGNTGNIIWLTTTGRAADLEATYEGQMFRMTAEDQGIFVMTQAIKGGLVDSYAKFSELNLDERKDVIAQTMKWNPEKSKEAIENFAYATYNAEANGDIALAIAGGDTAKAIEHIEKNLGYKHQEAVNRVGNGFKFISNEAYVEEGELKYTWVDKVSEEFDVYNLAALAAPMAELGVVGELVGVGAKVTVAEVSAIGASKIPGYIALNTALTAAPTSSIATKLVLGGTKYVAIPTVAAIGAGQIDSDLGLLAGVLVATPFMGSAMLASKAAKAAEVASTAIGVETGAVTLADESGNSIGKTIGLLKFQSQEHAEIAIGTGIEEGWITKVGDNLYRIEKDGRVLDFTYGFESEAGTQIPQKVAGRAVTSIGTVPENYAQQTTAIGKLSRASSETTEAASGRVVSAEQTTAETLSHASEELSPSKAAVANTLAQDVEGNVANLANDVIAKPVQTEVNQQVASSLRESIVSASPEARQIITEAAEDTVAAASIAAREAVQESSDNIARGVAQSFKTNLERAVQRESAVASSVEYISRTGTETSQIQTVVQISGEGVSQEVANQIGKKASSLGVKQFVVDVKNVVVESAVPETEATINMINNNGRVFMSLSEGQITENILKTISISVKEAKSVVVEFSGKGITQKAVEQVSNAALSSPAKTIVIAGGPQVTATAQVVNSVKEAAITMTAEATYDTGNKGILLTLSEGKIGDVLTNEIRAKGEGAAILAINVQGKGLTIKELQKIADAAYSVTEAEVRINVFDGAIPQTILDNIAADAKHFGQTIEGTFTIGGGKTIEIKLVSSPSAVAKSRVSSQVLADASEEATSLAVLETEQTVEQYVAAAEKSVQEAIQKSVKTSLADKAASASPDVMKELNSLAEQTAITSSAATEKTIQTSVNKLVQEIESGVKSTIKKSEGEISKAETLSQQYEDLTNKISKFTLEEKVNSKNIRYGEYQQLFAERQSVMNELKAALKTTDNGAIADTLKISTQRMITTSPSGELIEIPKILQEMRTLTSSESTIATNSRLQKEYNNLGKSLIGYYAQAEDGTLSRIIGISGSRSSEPFSLILEGNKYYYPGKIVDLYSPSEVRALFTIPRSELVPINNVQLRTAEETAALIAEQPVQYQEIEKILVKNVRRISFEEFDVARRQTIVGENGLNSILSDGQPYAVVAGRGEKGKSARWVYQLSKDEMTTTPERVIHISKAEELPNSYMNELLDSGITRFVIFDDASYTATEIRGGFMTKLNYAFSSKPRLQGQKLEIVVVAPYVTKYAEEQMTSYAAEKGIILKLLKTEYMPEVKDYLTPEQLVTWGGNRKGRTLIYFDHKVPDWLSFDSRINNLVIAKEPMPPYKWAEEKYNPLLKDTVYAKSEQLYWEDFTSRYGGPEAYANLL